VWSALGEVDRVQVGSLSIAFEWMGEGVPLLLLHGGVSDRREWRQQLEGLSDEFAVVAWDAPGCGRSSDPPDDFLMPDYADCLAGFIAALGLVRPHVVGLSFGGTLALELYRRHPNVPRTLVLASAYTGWAGSLPQRKSPRGSKQSRATRTCPDRSTQHGGCQPCSRPTRPSSW
jgi:pimeloyl-ACP methyl ester carboxylesterase